MIKIIATVNKKIPISGQDYSNNQASITLESEATADTIRNEIASLFQTAESSVDFQLHLQQQTSSPPTAHPRQQKSLPMATPKQLNLIKNKAGRNIDNYLNRYQTSIDNMDIKTASEIIDELMQN